MAVYSRSSIKAPDAKDTLAPEMQARWDLVVVGIAVLLVIIDQFTKHLVVAHFSGAHKFDVVPVLGNILSFQYLGNTGAAFSSFTTQPLVLGFLILVAVGVIVWLYATTRARANPLLKVTFGLIFGGAVGNLIDRVRLGYVVDFIHFQLPSIHFDFAVFNMADAGISVGVVLLALIFWTMPREHEPEPGLAETGTSGMAHAVPSKPGANASTVPARTVTAPATASATRTPTNPIKPASGNGQTTNPNGKPASDTKTPTVPVKAASTTKTAVPGTKAPTAGGMRPPARNASVASGHPTHKKKKRAK